MKYEKQNFSEIDWPQSATGLDGIIVQKLIEQLQGRIQVKSSQRSQQWTRFTLILSDFKLHS
jgi:signal transduction histidine kinase